MGLLLQVHLYVTVRTALARIMCMGWSAVWGGHLKHLCRHLCCQSGVGCSPGIYFNAKASCRPHLPAACPHLQQEDTSTQDQRRSASASSWVLPDQKHSSGWAQYKSIRVLGEGGFGKTHLATCLASGEQVAVKVGVLVALQWSQFTRDHVACLSPL